MTNLPITTNPAKATTASNQAAGAPESVDTQNNQPFGEVLARQINEPSSKDVTAVDKLAADTLKQISLDAKISKKDSAEIKLADIIPSENATVIPTVMLAVLFPQAMNTNTVSIPTSTNIDTSTIDSLSPSFNQRTHSSHIANFIPASKTDVKADPNVTIGTNPNIQNKDNSFSTALTESANRTTSNLESITLDRQTMASHLDTESNAAALASLQSKAASIATPTFQPIQVTINSPVTQDKWADEFNQKITWLASSNKDQTAELHLNPPQLGPLDVVIKVSGDQATALFTSPHAAVRDAIEQAMPKLRDMLADNGIFLGNAMVSDQSPRGQDQNNSQRSTIMPINNISEIPLVSTTNSVARISPISRHNGIVDTFA